MKYKIIGVFLFSFFAVVFAFSYFSIKETDRKILEHSKEMLLNAKMPSTWDDLGMQLSADTILDAEEKLRIYFVNRKMETNGQSIKDSPYYSMLKERYLKLLNNE